MSRISDKLAAAASRKVINSNPDHALIKQMGEALENHCWPNTSDQFDDVYHAALKEYNNWKQERGG